MKESVLALRKIEFRTKPDPDHPTPRKISLPLPVQYHTSSSLSSFTDGNNWFTSEGSPRLIGHQQNKGIHPKEETKSSESLVTEVGRDIPANGHEEYHCHMRMKP